MDNVFVDQGAICSDSSGIPASTPLEKLMKNVFVQKVKSTKLCPSYLWMVICMFILLLSLLIKFFMFMGAVIQNYPIHFYVPHCFFFLGLFANMRLVISISWSCRHLLLTLSGLVHIGLTTFCNFMPFTFNNCQVFMENMNW